MVLSVVLLDSDEKFIEFLDSELIDITETQTKKGIRTCSVSYEIIDLDYAKEVFKMGNKLAVLNDETIDDGLFVIPENLHFDLFQENRISFQIEEVLVELNFAPLFTQTDLTTENGFTLTNINGEPAVTVNRTALEFWFGKYFDIGIVQSCLSERLSQIAPTGTMTLMKLLRYIEDETSNIFVTRYEKDLQENRINRYLDFLNPDSGSLSWNLKCEFEFHNEDDPDSITVDNETIVSEVIEEPDDVVNFPEFQQQVPLDFDNLIVQFRTNNTVLTSIDLSGEGLNGDAEIYTFLINYANGNVNINIVGKNDVNSSENISTQINTNVPSYSTVETLTLENIEIELPNNSVFEIIDTSSNKVIYYQKINPVLGNVQPQILDLGYNTTDIDFEVDESDTFTAIAPVITVSDVTDSNSLSRENYNTIIQRWLNLNVKKGDIVPMIVQKVVRSDKPWERRTQNPSVVSSAYWNRPLKPNDQTDSDDKQYEYLEGTAYWPAPFSKKRGEIFVADDTDTGVDYNQIKGKRNVNEGLLVTSTPKIGQVETSDENVYAIFNDVCNKLKEKRYPNVNLKASVANFLNGFNNNYGVYDKVFLKVPGVSKLVSAQIVKTVKNPKNRLENTVELDSYSISSKAVQYDTEIISNNLQFKYGNKRYVQATLLDYEGNPLSGKLLSFSVSKTTDSGTSFVKAYTKKTNSNGIAKIYASWHPADYTVDITYGGDVIYASSANSVVVNIAGTVQTSENNNSSASKKTTNTTTDQVTKYYDKYGRSPDKKTLMAIALPSRKSENDKYGYKFMKAPFKNYCPCCGKEGTLYWGWNYGKYFRGRNEWMGSEEGHFFCDHCDADFSGINGENHVKGGKPKLTRLANPVKSSREEAQKLVNGQLPYETVTKNVESKNVSSTKQRTQIERSTYPVSQSGEISASVISKALSVVENSSGVPAAKKIIKWVAENIKWEDRKDFYQSPQTTLKRGKGNCCTQADLAAQMLDASGVCSELDVMYVHVHKAKKGHVFLRINGTYVDPCKTSNPWGHYLTGYGSPGSGAITKYPNLPFDRDYS